MKIVSKAVIIILSSSLLIGMTAKVGKTVNGTTVGKYQKPGAPVDMSYVYGMVEAGEVVNVDITLITSLREGDLSVDIYKDASLDMVNTIDKNMKFKLNSTINEYKFSLKVLSSKEGLHYIRVKTTARDGRMRSFAIPIKIGLTTKDNLKLEKRSIGTSSITVTKGVETVR